MASYSFHHLKIEKKYCFINIMWILILLIYVAGKGIIHTIFAG